MAKYTITHSCGCTAEIDIVGPGTERERKAAWHASKPCRECAVAAATAEAAKAAAETGLPVLSGSDKQVAWAETLRQAIAMEIETLLPALRANGTAEQVDQAERAAAAIMANASAKYWVDNRSVSARARIAEAMGL